LGVLYPASEKRLPRPAMGTTIEIMRLCLTGFADLADGF